MALEWFRTWALDPHQDMTAGNSSGLDKIENKSDSIKSIILQANDTAIYSFSTSDLQLATLGRFFASDCRGFMIDEYIKWALNPSEDETGFNTTWLHKSEKTIVLGSLIHESNKAFTSFLVEDFIRLLEKWKHLDATHPKKVRFSINNDNGVELEVLETFEEK